MTLFLQYVNSKSLLNNIVIDEKEEKLKSIFSDLESWPVKTKFPCFSCHRKYSTRPWPIPMSGYPQHNNYGNEINTKMNINILGYSCSPACAVTYIQENANFTLSEKNNKIGLLHSILINIVSNSNSKTSKQFGGIIITPELVKASRFLTSIKINPAPNFKELDIYGGNLSKMEFEDKINRCIEIKKL